MRGTNYWCPFSFHAHKSAFSILFLIFIAQNLFLSYAKTDSYLIRFDIDQI